MGDGFRVRFSSVNTGGLPNPDGAGPNLGTRFGPRFRLSLGDFQLHLRFEASLTNAATTDIGSKYWDSQPSSSLAEESPLSFWARRPEGDSKFQGNFGMRRLTLSYQPHRDFRMTVGPNRYDITESERLCMSNVYSNQCKFAFVSFPMGVFGTEIAYDRERDEEILRHLLLAMRAEHVGWGGIFFMGHGLVTFALGQEEAPPELTLYAYVGAHDNDDKAEDALVAPGFTHGEGVLAQLDYGILTGLVAFSNRFGNSLDDLGFRESSNRQVTTLATEFHPGDVRIRGNLSFLNRIDREGPDIEPPVGQNETHTEFALGYNFLPSLSMALGYRGAYGGERPVHMGFLAMRTDLRHTFPIESPNK